MTGNHYCFSLRSIQGDARWRNDGQTDGSEVRVPSAGKVLRERFVLHSSATLHCPPFLPSLLPLFDFPFWPVICFVLFLCYLLLSSEG